MNLLSKWGVPRIDFREFLVDLAARQTPEIRDKYLLYSKEKSIIPTATLINILNALFFEKVN